MIAIMPSHQLGRPLVIIVSEEDNRSRIPPGLWAMYSPSATPRSVVSTTWVLNSRMVRGSASRITAVTSRSPLEALMVTALPKSKESVRTALQKMRGANGSSR